MTNTATVKMTDTDRYAITYADSAGHASYPPMPTKEMEGSIVRLVAAGLLVESTKTLRSGMAVRNGLWLTEPAWLIRRALRKAANLPANEVITHVLMLRPRPAGACELTYAAGVTRKHTES